VVFEIVGQDTASGMRMDSDEVELLANPVGDFGDLFVRNAELGVATGGDFLVVACSDSRIDADRNPTVVAAFLEAVEGIGRADSNRQPWSLIGEVDRVVQIVIRWVNRRLLKRVRVGPCVDRPLEFAPRRTLDVGTDRQQRLQHRPAGVGFGGVHNVGVGKRRRKSEIVLFDTIEIGNVQWRLVVGGQRPEPFVVPVGNPTNKG